MRTWWQVFDWQRFSKFGLPASPALWRPKKRSIASTPAHRHLAARCHPAIPAEQLPAPPQHPSTRSHAPPPSVCICIVRTITTAVDTSKSRTGALAPASSPGAQATKHLRKPPSLACKPTSLARKALYLYAQDFLLCVRSAATRRARLSAWRSRLCGLRARFARRRTGQMSLRAKCLNSARQAKHLARRAKRLAGRLSCPVRRHRPSGAAPPHLARKPRRAAHRSVASMRRSQGLGCSIRKAPCAECWGWHAEHIGAAVAQTGLRACLLSPACRAEPVTRRSERVAARCLTAWPLAVGCPV